MTKCTLGIDVGKSNIRVAIAEHTPELKYYYIYGGLTLLVLGILVLTIGNNLHQ